MNSKPGWYMSTCIFMWFLQHWAHTYQGFVNVQPSCVEVSGSARSIWSRLESSKQVYELPRTPPSLSPRRLPSCTYTHLTVKCLWVCFVIMKWQMTLWAAATLKWNVLFKAGGNRSCERQSRLRKFGQSREKTHTHTHRHSQLGSSNLYLFWAHLCNCYYFLSPLCAADDWQDKSHVGSSTPNSECTDQALGLRAPCWNNKVLPQSWRHNIV